MLLGGHTLFQNESAGTAYAQHGLYRIPLHNLAWQNFVIVLTCAPGP
jgi:hypothetical protein